MAILELIAIWFVISIVVGVLLGITIHRMSHDAPDAPLKDDGRKREVRSLIRHLHSHSSVDFR